MTPLAAARAALAEYDAPRCDGHDGQRVRCNRLAGHEGRHGQNGPPRTRITAEHLRTALAEHDLLLAERDAYRAQVSDLLARVEAQSEEIAALAREGNRWRVLASRVAATHRTIQHEDACDADFREHDAAHAAITAALAAHPPEKP